MKRLLLSAIALLCVCPIKADELDYLEYAQISPEGIGVVMTEARELGNEIFLGLDYQRDSLGNVQYFIHLKFTNDNIIVSSGRKLLVKLKDGSIITLQSTRFEDKSTKGMYAIRWVGWKDNFVETTNLNLHVIYPIEQPDLDKIIAVGAIKARIDSDAKVFKWGNGKDDRFSWLLKQEREVIDRIINRDPNALYKDF